MNQRFYRWFNLLPKTWREGLWAAIRGDVFIGNLDRKDGVTEVSVIFCPTKYADMFERILRENGVLEGRQKD